MDFIGLCATYVPLFNQRSSGVDSPKADTRTGSGICASDGKNVER